MKKPSRHEWIPKYFEALGSFIHVFSATERQLNLLLCHFAGVSKRNGKALFSGIKTDKAIKFIEKITERHNKKVRDDLSYIFAQLKLINDERNLILHQGTENVGKTGAIISNKGTVFRDSQLKKVRISPQIMQDMTKDLEKIQAHISVYLDGKSLAFKLYAPRLLSVSWLYKSPSKRNRGIHPKKNPPKS